jgi:hypothetical protein
MSQVNFLTQFSQIVSRLTLGLGVVVSGLVLAPATPAQVTPMVDGIYLFGETPERDQLNAAYMIVKVTGEQTIGAFYMPSSAFDCFYGQLEDSRMAMNIVSSYDAVTYPYSQPLGPSPTLVAGSHSAGPAVPTGFYPIPEITSADREILHLCQGVIEAQI